MIISGPHTGLVLQNLDKSTIGIGRRCQNLPTDWISIRLPQDKELSGLHAILHRTLDTWFVYDAGSTNKTRLLEANTDITNFRLHDCITLSGSRVNWENSTPFQLTRSMILWCGTTFLKINISVPSTISSSLMEENELRELSESYEQRQAQSESSRKVNHITVRTTPDRMNQLDDELNANEEIQPTDIASNAFSASDEHQVIHTGKETSPLTSTVTPTTDRQVNLTEQGNQPVSQTQCCAAADRGPQGENLSMLLRSSHYRMSEMEPLATRKRRRAPSQGESVLPLFGKQVEMGKELMDVNEEEKHEDREVEIVDTFEGQGVAVQMDLQGSKKITTQKTSNVRKQIQSTRKKSVQASILRRTKSSLEDTMSFSSSFRSQLIHQRTGGTDTYISTPNGDADVILHELGGAGGDNTRKRASRKQRNAEGAKSGTPVLHCATCTVLLKQHPNHTCRACGVALPLAILLSQPKVRELIQEKKASLGNIFHSNSESSAPSGDDRLSRFRTALPNSPPSVQYPDSKDGVRSENEQMYPETRHLTLPQDLRMQLQAVDTAIATLFDLRKEIVTAMENTIFPETNKSCVQSPTVIRAVSTPLESNEGHAEVSNHSTSCPDNLSSLMTILDDVRYLETLQRNPSTRLRAISESYAHRIQFPKSEGIDRQTGTQLPISSNLQDNAQSPTSSPQRIKVEEAPQVSVAAVQISPTPAEFDPILPTPLATSPSEPLLTPSSQSLRVSSPSLQTNTTVANRKLPHETVLSQRMSPCATPPRPDSMTKSKLVYVTSPDAIVRQGSESVISPTNSRKLRLSSTDFVSSAAAIASPVPSIASTPTSVPPTPQFSSMSVDTLRSQLRHYGVDTVHFRKTLSRTETTLSMEELNSHGSKLQNSESIQSREFATVSTSQSIPKGESFPGSSTMKNFLAFDKETQGDGQASQQFPSSAYRVQDMVVELEELWAWEKELRRLEPKECNVPRSSQNIYHERPTSTLATESTRSTHISTQIRQTLKSNSEDDVPFNVSEPTKSGFISASQRLNSDQNVGTISHSQGLSLSEALGPNHAVKNPDAPVTGVCAKEAMDFLLSHTTRRVAEIVPSIRKVVQSHPNLHESIVLQNPISSDEIRELLLVDHNIACSIEDVQEALRIIGALLED